MSMFTVFKEKPGDYFEKITSRRVNEFTDTEKISWKYFLKQFALVI